MDINIRLLGSDLSVEVASDGSVGMLRGVVADEAGVDVRHMRLRADGMLLTDDEARLCDVLLDAGSVVEGDCWKEDSVLARDILLHEHGIDVASPPDYDYTIVDHMECILGRDNPDQLDLLLRSKLDVGDSDVQVTLQMAVAFGAHRCVDVMLGCFDYSTCEITTELLHHCHYWEEDFDTYKKVLCELRILRHCRERGVVVDQTKWVQKALEDLIRRPAHPELCQLLMRMGAVITPDVIRIADKDYKTFLQSCDVSPDIFLAGPCMPACRHPCRHPTWSTSLSDRLDFVRSLHASWYERAHPDGDKDVSWYGMFSDATFGNALECALNGTNVSALQWIGEYCSDERIPKRILEINRLNEHRQRQQNRPTQRPSVIGASRVNSVFRGNSEGPLCEEPCDPGCRCITCLDEERYTGRRFCLGGGGGGWRKVPAVVRAQRKARIAQQMSRAAQRCRRQR